MYYRKEFDANQFEFWGGAEAWADEFREKGMMDRLGEYIEGLFPCGEIPSATDINDIVWFDDGLHALLDDKEGDENE